jgi:uncharacterized protein
MSTFVIVQKSNGLYQFSLRAGNGRAILISPEFTSISICEKCIQAVREYATDDASFAIMTAANGDSYFNLEASNGKILGSSVMYESRRACSQDIIAVKTFAPEAFVDSYYAGEVH